MKKLIAAAALLAALAGCCAPRRTWPPKPEWDQLDPKLCHPYPCDAGRAEWPGTVSNR